MEIEKEVANLVASLRFFQEKSATLKALQERVKSALSDVIVKLPSLTPYEGHPHISGKYQITIPPSFRWLIDDEHVYVYSVLLGSSLVIEYRVGNAPMTRTIFLGDDVQLRDLLTAALILARLREEHGIDVLARFREQMLEHEAGALKALEIIKHVASLLKTGST